MTNEKRQQAEEQLSAEQSDGERMEKFDVTKWAIEKFDIEPEDLCGNLIVARISFNKGAELERERVLDLVLEEIKDKTWEHKTISIAGSQSYMTSITEAIEVLKVDELKQIISKLKGEK